MNARKFKSQPFINPKYAPKPLTQNIALDMVDLEVIERAVRNKLECDRKRKVTRSEQLSQEEGRDTSYQQSGPYRS